MTAISSRNVWERCQGVGHASSIIGETPMTGTERQVRNRAARMSDAPVIHIRHLVDRRRRIQRRNNTIATLTALQAEYGAWLEALRQSARRRYSRGLANDRRTRSLELQAVEPPRGFGRD
jgi:hypothetical protein